MRTDRTLSQGTVSDALLDPVFQIIEDRTDLLLQRIRPVLVAYVKEGVQGAITPGVAIGAAAVLLGVVVLGVTLTRRRRSR